MRDNEIDSFLDLLRDNDKHQLLNREWKLLYRKSSDGRYSDQQFVKEKYENKQNILCLMESENDNVLGGYSSSGWNSNSIQFDVFNHDDTAFIFGIRSSKGKKPIIANVEPEMASQAIVSNDGYYLMFGSDWVINLKINGKFYTNSSYCYSLPKGSHLLGGQSDNWSDRVKDLEIFQVI